MSNQTTGLLVALLILAVGALFFLQYSGTSWETPREKYLMPNDVKGMAVEHEGKLFTLSFQQQQQAVNILNRSVKIGSKLPGNGKPMQFGYDRLIIYMFKGKDIEIQPVTLVNQQLIFRVDAWNPEGLMRETGPGELQPLLMESYQK